MNTAAQRTTRLSLCGLFCSILLLCSCSSASVDLYYNPFVKKRYYSSDAVRKTTLPDEVLRRKGYRQIGVIHVKLIYSQCAKKCLTYSHDMSSIERLTEESRKRGAHLLKVLENNVKRARNYNARGRCLKTEEQWVYEQRYVNGQVKQVNVREHVCVKWEPVKVSELSYYSRGVLWRKD